MKENKNTQIKVRITPTDRELIDNYCAKHGMSISDFIRMACQKELNKEEK